MYLGNNPYIGIVTPAQLSVGAPVWDASGNLTLATGRLTFGGTGQRITGDFSNATHANRVAFQTTTANGNTSPFIIPNGTGATSSIVVANASDPTNSSYGQLSVNSTSDVRVLSGQLGTGTYLPMTFWTGGSERMRIDTSGNVGIGTSSPSQRLHIKSSNGVVISESTGDVTTTGTAYLSLNDVNGQAAYLGYGGDGSGIMALWNRKNGATIFATNNTERMRIDSSGNVGIASAPVSPYRLTVTGAMANSWTAFEAILELNVRETGNRYSLIDFHGDDTYTDFGLRIGRNNGGPNAESTFNHRGTGPMYFYCTEAAPIQFATSATERARIDSSGNLLVGTNTATSSSNTFLVNSAKHALVIANGATADSTVLLSCIKSGLTSSTSQRYIGFGYNGGANGNGAIAGNGDSQATFITLSDERLKENIEDLPPQLANVMALRPVEFDYKSTGGHQIGFIAQEVQTVYPDLVAEGDDGYLTLAGFDKNTARLIKAIQEQQTLIQDLTTRLAALEAK